MNKTSIFFSALLFLLFSSSLLAQTGDDQFFSPKKPDRSVLFGKDIVIYDSPNDDQRNLTFCSAYNGWLFAAYSYTTNNDERCSVLKSTDNGMTWEIIMDDVFPFSYILTKISLTTSGNSISNLRLFLGVILLDTNDNKGHIWVGRYKVDPLLPDGEVMNDVDHCKDISLANDFSTQAMGSNPNSIGILYSKTGTVDSIVFRSSGNGISLDSRQAIAYTSNHFSKVALTYGSSLSNNTGRYFAVWEEKSDEYTSTGHIYSAHSEPTFNGSFTTPVCLDSLDPSVTNLCRNPVIACQYGTMDNDSSNITTIVLCEKFEQTTGNYNIKGFFNKKSTQTSIFQPFTCTNFSHHNIEPDIAFNPSDSSFMVTWFDSTTKDLPYITNGMNLSSPDTWTVISPGYNDEDNLTSPNPKLIFNPAMNSGANVWINDNSGGNGVAMFDALYSTYTGWYDYNGTAEPNEVRIFPNPCSTILSIEFDLETEDNVIITIYNMMGQPLDIIRNNYLGPGRHIIQVDLSSLNDGCYMYKFNSQRYSSCGKVVIRK